MILSILTLLSATSASISELVVKEDIREDDARFLVFEVPQHARRSPFQMLTTSRPTYQTKAQFVNPDGDAYLRDIKISCKAGSDCECYIEFGADKASPLQYVRTSIFASTVPKCHVADDALKPLRDPSSHSCHVKVRVDTDLALADSFCEVIPSTLVNAFTSTLPMTETAYQLTELDTNTILVPQYEATWQMVTASPRAKSSVGYLIKCLPTDTCQCYITPAAGDHYHKENQVECTSEYDATKNTIMRDLRGNCHVTVMAENLAENSHLGSKRQWCQSTFITRLTGSVLDLVGVDHKIIFGKCPPRFQDQKIEFTRFRILQIHIHETIQFRTILDALIIANALSFIFLQGRLRHLRQLLVKNGKLPWECVKRIAAKSNTELESALFLQCPRTPLRLARNPFLELFHTFLELEIYFNQITKFSSHLD